MCRELRQIAGRKGWRENENSGPALPPQRRRPVPHPHERRPVLGAPVAGDPRLRVSQPGVRSSRSRALSLRLAACQFLDLLFVGAARRGALGFGCGLLAGCPLQFLAFCLVFNLGCVCHSRASFTEIIDVPLAWGDASFMVAGIDRR